ncbi:MAG: aminotransferase class III-fold pyridoxal phosphate-dependent enzyme [Actinomycetota bacterium]|nr:aminotransferase class III-fold pyridoxal phosphate-dependent enzyme [Actinomycetota bacterium]
MATSFWHPFANMSDVKDKSFTVVRGEGNYVYDKEDRAYFDATASLWYANAGYGRREIIDAIKNQAELLACYSTFGDITNEPAEELADFVAQRSPMENSKVFFVSGGGDAIETAAKLARKYFHELGQGDRTLIVSRKDSYHGTHGFGTSLAGIAPNRVGWGDLISGVALVDRDDPEDLVHLANSVGSDKIAAIFVEPVIGAGGVHLPTEGYLERIREITKEIGALMIVDSVICGFGRLGYWFGPERFGVVPDMITFAKGITSGYVPLGGVVVSGEIADPFFNKGATFRHGPTYAGHPLAAAAGIANCQFLENEGLIAKGQELEGKLKEALDASSDSPLIEEVRGGLGLLGALEFDTDRRQSDPSIMAKVQMEMRSRGFLVRPLVSSIAVSPPLSVTEDEIERLGNAFVDALKAADR